MFLGILKLLTFLVVSIYGCVGGASGCKGVVAGVLKHIKFSYIFAGLLMRG